MNYILAIESSCDDTSAAIISNGEVLSNKVATQEVHENYGGVVPELASREHIQKIIPVVSAALKEANIETSDLDAIAVTKGPGLLGSLIVGVTFAKSLAQSLNIPIIEVQHMQAHVMANFAGESKPEFPFICLTVSGGHTQLVLVKDYLDMTILGQSIDDAAGEAFDKTGKMLGLKYPSGPIIDKLAQQGQSVYEFPKSKVGKHEFSFSGFKTAVMYFLRRETDKNPQFIKQNLNNICASIQNSICETLIEKLRIAAEEYEVITLAMAGGVSANSELRKRFNELCKANNYKAFVPPISLCTDNAGMIGMVGWYKYLDKNFSDLSIAPAPRMQF